MLTFSGDIKIKHWLKIDRNWLIIFLFHEDKKSNFSNEISEASKKIKTFLFSRKKHLHIFNRSLHKGISSNLQSSYPICNWLSLAHFWPMFPFFTPWKYQKPKAFRRNKTETLTRNGLNIAWACLFLLDVSIKQPLIKSHWEMTKEEKYALQNLDLPKVIKRNTRLRYEICSKLTIKTPERHQWHRSGALIVNFEHVIAGWIRN